MSQCLAASYSPEMLQLSAQLTFNEAKITMPHIPFLKTILLPSKAKNKNKQKKQSKTKKGTFGP
uniref:Uncharacterized protein n=1 Tax=Anguilla anguilla TaxID=7936 RepID=A0A0E9WLR8_ANGAN